MKTFALAVCWLALALPSRAAEQTPDLASMYRIVKPSVVYVLVANASGGGNGSGFIYDSDTAKTIVVTANHVVENAQQIDVVLDSNTAKRYHARVLEHDRKRDVAFLQIDVGNRRKLDLADRAQIVEGSQVALVGYPRAARAFKDFANDEIRPSVHAGIVSAVRVNGAIVQIDATSDYGDSGGPVIDVKSGRVIGILRGSLLGASTYGIAPIPGSAFAASALTLYAVRNGIPEEPQAASSAGTKSASGTDDRASAKYRVAFPSSRGATPALQQVLDDYGLRLRDRFSDGNQLYPVTGPLLNDEDSDATSRYCDDLRTNAIVTKSQSWNVADDGAKATFELTVRDCYGIPFFHGSSEKVEARDRRKSTSVQAHDMNYAAEDAVFADFEAFRTAHAIAWKDLLLTGTASDPDAANALLVGLAIRNHVARVRYIRDGRGAKAGLRAGDVIDKIDGSKIDEKLTVDAVQTLLEKATTAEVLRPEGTLTITLR